MFIVSLAAKIISELLFVSEFYKLIVLVYITDYASWQNKTNSSNLVLVCSMWQCS